MTRQRMRFLPIVAFWAILGVGLTEWSPAWANHQDNIVSICYDCHSLNAGLAEPGTSSINQAANTLPAMKTLNGGTAPATFGCTFCHNINRNSASLMKNSFSPFDGRTSQHPLDRPYSLDANRNVTLGVNQYGAIYRSNWDNSFSTPANQIGCTDCHDVTSATGYPNHPIPGTGTRAPANNPLMLRGVATMDNNGHAPNTFCLNVCHTGTGAAPAAYKMGHYGWGGFNGTTLKEHDGTALKTAKCTDCHETHAAWNKNGLQGEAKQSPNNVDPANCTNLCHNNTRFASNGHGKASVALPCSACHNSGVNHRDPVNPKRFNTVEAPPSANAISIDLRGNGVDDDYNGVIDDAGEQFYQYSDRANCGVCHSNMMPHQGAISSNTSATSGKVASCLLCHDPHGKVTDNNLMMIRKTLQPGSKNVNYWTSRTDLIRPDGNGACDVPACHGSTLAVILANPAHTAAGVTTGTDCLGCHSHSSNSGAPSFAPVCNSCHDYAGQPQLPSAHRLSGSHAKHTDNVTLGGYGLSCTNCHFNYSHNGSTMNPGEIWSSKFQSAKVDIRFDNTWNPGSPTYNGILASAIATPSAPGTPLGNGVCAGLYCHGNSPSFPTWPTGSNPMPSWDNAASGACGTCHKATRANGPADFAHAKHVDNAAVGYNIECDTCHYDTTHDGITIFSPSEHLNRLSKVRFNPTDNMVNAAGAAYSGTLTVGDSATDMGAVCTNIYCHSLGTRLVSAGGPYDNGAYGWPRWNQGALACNACHGSTADISGMPAYANLLPPINKINSHPKHIQTSYGCQVCHVNTTTTGNTITNRANHVNSVYNANPDNAASHGFTYSFPANCTTVVCHGSNSASWGGAPPQCSNCHLSSGVETEQYQTTSNTWYSAGVTARIDNTEWFYSGHGRTVIKGVYDGSGHPAADFGASAGIGDPCTYCHDVSASHRSAANPFRLKWQATGVFVNDGWNATCLICHGKTAPRIATTGYQPTGTASAEVAVPTDRVDSAHYGAKHVGDNTLGGRLCWDCHDGHGDSPASTGNIYMIQKTTLAKTDGVYGYRGTAGEVTKPIVFNKDNTVSAGGNWANPSPNFDGVCQVCHHGDGTGTGGAKYYTQSQFQAHNQTLPCLGCHKHDDQFKASCNACHGDASALGLIGAPPYEPTAGVRIWSTTVDNLLAPGLTGVGDHRSAAGYITLSSHDNWMSGAAGCNECHTTASGTDAAHNTGKLSANMSQLSTHNWSAGLPALFDNNGTAGATTSVVDDSCNNINCHGPFYNGNAGKSGTPLPYKRFWTNQMLWDCYSCHPYDGTTVTTRPATGNKADNTMSTGAHLVHVDNNQIGCNECHNVTGYSATSLTGTHKNGLVDVSFAGAPKPAWASPGAYDNNGLAPTDDNGAAGHRSWGTCSTLYCHSPGQTTLLGGNLLPANYVNVRWDNALSGKCGTCHGGDGVTDNPGNWITSGSHTKHVNATNNKYACSVCHNGLGRGVPSHVDNVINLAFSTIGAIPLSPTVYSQGLAHAPGTGFGKCTTNYCHGKDATTPLTGGVNQMVLDNATWGTISTGACGTCHGAPGGLALGASNYPTSGSHARHMLATDNAGPAILLCTDCHTDYAKPTHGDGIVQFRTTWIDNTPRTLQDNGMLICNPCHAAGVATAKANWNAVTQLDCLTCHGGGTPANSRADNLGIFAPNVGGDNTTYGAYALGHNRPAGNYPSGNVPANQPCAVCHKLALKHITGINDNTYSGTRLSDTVNGVNGITTVSGLCKACHANASSPAIKKNVNSHGNMGYPARLEAPFQELLCNQCHEPHGMVNVSIGATGNNLWMINPTISVDNAFSAAGKVSPVRLFRKAGVNSFNAYAPPAGQENLVSAYSANAADQLCVVCHISTFNPGRPMAYNIAGNHVTPAFNSVEAGKDCSGCHAHNKDGILGTVDGLMPLACNACHSYPGLDNSAVNLRQMSASHRNHVGVPGVNGELTGKGYECTACHYNYNHNQSLVTSANDWSANFVVSNVDIRFDNTLNPGAPTYNSQNASTLTAQGNGGSGICAGLYCHGNAATQATWGGSGTTPAWNGGAGCGTCHGVDATFTQGNHPAHLAAAFGPGINAFTTAFCFSATGCHTSYGLSTATTHDDGLVGFRTSLADNTQVGLGATTICVACHTTYKPASVPSTGDNLVRTRANWDNTTYKLPCVSCHNGAAWQTVNAGGDRAANIDNTYTLNGHGAASIDNVGTVSIPPVACAVCHDELGAHIGTTKDATNPWRLDPVLTNYNQVGGLDQFCLQQCHSMAALSPRHAWRVNGSGVAPAQIKNSAFNTHPTSMQVVPQAGAPPLETIDKSRWFQVPSDNNMPLFGDLSVKPLPARTNGSLLICVTCHDPHGVGTALTATRNFSGVNTEAVNKKMLRYNYSGAGVGQSALCAKCHK